MVDIFIDTVIADVRQIHANAFENHKPTLIVRELLKKHAKAIHEAHTSGNNAVKFHLGSWCPGLVGQTPEQIMAADLSLAQVYESVAREYGYADWQSVENLGEKQLDNHFENAVEQVITGELSQLQNQLGAYPKLVTQRSVYGHGSTLLHYLGANGVESHRQMTPMNCVQIAQCLIDHGADVNAPANMYGGGSTTLGLVLSSAHPAKAGVTDALAAVLKDAGAS